MWFDIILIDRSAYLSTKFHCKHSDWCLHTLTGVPMDGEKTKKNALATTRYYLPLPLTQIIIFFCSVHTPHKRKTSVSIHIIDPIHCTYSFYFSFTKVLNGSICISIAQHVYVFTSTCACVCVRWWTSNDNCRIAIDPNTYENVFFSNFISSPLQHPSISMKRNKLNQMK